MRQFTGTGGEKRGKYKEGNRERRDKGEKSEKNMMRWEVDRKRDKRMYSPSSTADSLIFVYQ